jgi:hypothetical protein
MRRFGFAFTLATLAATLLALLPALTVFADTWPPHI